MLNEPTHLDHPSHHHQQQHQHHQHQQQHHHHQGSWCSLTHLSSPHFFQQHSSAFHPGSFTSPGSFGTTSLARMESTFCKNFVCCSIPLDDLHDLLEHYEQAHCQQSSVSSSDSSSSSSNRPDVIVFEDEDEWSGTESVSTLPSSNTRSTFDRSQSPPDHNWASASSSHSRDPPNQSRRKNTTSNLWPNFDEGFGIPPSLLDGQHQSDHNLTNDSNRLLMMIDADEDGSSSAGSDRNLENLSSHPDPTKKRRLGSEQRDWESSRDKPFKCSVPGCEKAYKQPNGLKYHKAHGHCSQKTLSVEEESKTFVCHDVVCGKRYKNINGLRYHYQHTGPHGAIGLQLLSLGLHPSGSALNSSNLNSNENSNHQHRHPLLTSSSNCSWASNSSQDEGNLDESASYDIRDVVMDQS